MNLEYKQEKKIIFKLHLHSIWSFRHPAKPLFMGFSAIFQAIQTRKSEIISIHLCMYSFSGSIWFYFSPIILTIWSVPTGIINLLSQKCYQPINQKSHNNL